MLFQFEGLPYSTMLDMLRDSILVWAKGVRHTGGVAHVGGKRSGQYKYGYFLFLFVFYGP